MHNAIINYELLARVENDRELLRELLLIFKEEFPGPLQALRDAVDSLDGDRITAQAHTLKGKLSNLAATSAADAAARLELSGQNRGTSKFQDACSSFEPLIVRHDLLSENFPASAALSSLRPGF